MAPFHDQGTPVMFGRRRRSRNAAFEADVYALTILTAVRPGGSQRLRRSLAALAPDASPFARLETTHFARLVLLDQLVFEGPPERRPVVPCEHLLFTAVIEGTTDQARDAYLTEMCATVGAFVDAVWGACAGAPPKPSDEPHAFVRYMVGHELRSRAFFAQYDAGVKQARDACAVRDEVRAFAAAHQHLPAPALQQAFRDERDRWIDDARG